MTIKVKFVFEVDGKLYLQIYLDEFFQILVVVCTKHILQDEKEDDKCIDCFPYMTI